MLLTRISFFIFIFFKKGNKREFQRTMKVDLWLSWEINYFSHFSTPFPSKLAFLSCRERCGIHLSEAGLRFRFLPWAVPQSVEWSKLPSFCPVRQSAWSAFRAEIGCTAALLGSVLGGLDLEERVSLYSKWGRQWKLCPQQVGETALGRQGKAQRNRCNK